MVGRSPRVREVAGAIPRNTFKMVVMAALICAQGLRGLHYDRLTGVMINGPVVLVSYPENAAL